MQSENAHATLSASGAKKWINCPGSVQMESQFEDSTSAYAEEGTTAHALGEAKLRLALKEITRVQYHKLIKPLNITEDMEDYTDGYRDFVLERFNHAKSKTKDAILMLEQRLDFSDWVPGGFGTGDVVIIGDEVMEIIDLKYGKGVSVSAEDNPQLKLYALGAMSEYSLIYDIGVVVMTIYQPRTDNVNSDTIMVEELLMWGDEVKEKAQIAHGGTGACNSGKHCDDGFCKARAVCRAYADERSKMATYDFAKPTTLLDDEIAEIIDLAEKLASWCKIVKDYALEQALKGTKYPGFKLVEGRSNRTYIDEKQVSDTLKELGYTDHNIYNIKLKGITDMEKLLGKKDFTSTLGSLIIKPQGAPTLVKSEDKRAELNSAQEDFKDVS